VPLRFGLDGASCVATGAAAWAAGKRVVPAINVFFSAEAANEANKTIKEREEKIEEVHSSEVKRLEVRNALESYFYEVRSWLNGKDGSLLNGAVIGPYLDKITLWFEDAEYAEEPTPLEVYSEKFSEVKEFVQKEGAAFFEKKVKEKEDREKELEEAAEKERQRR